MRIDGKIIAEKILADLTSRVAALKQKGVVLTLAVIQVGDDPGSTAYIRQKQRAAETIGAVLNHDKLSLHTSLQHVNMLIHEHNANPTIHGIIVQRPLPDTLERGGTLAAIVLTKDVDGFVQGSPFNVPVAAAVLTILQFTFFQLDKFAKLDQFNSWLQTKRIIVLGRGDTAGKPIAEHLRKLGYNPTVVHSHTKKPDDVIRSANIVISCVGKPNVVRRDNLKPGAILIGVGIWRDDEGKLHGDYEEEKIEDIASAYTPTPGGVGPVNVASLMQNLVLAAQKSH